MTKYIWDVESDNVLTETDENDVTTVVYTNEPNQFGNLISQRRGSTTSTYHYDALGSTRELTDSTETVTDTYIYTAFGETVATTGTTTNSFRYVGEHGYYFNTETDDYYVRARTYDPENGRWKSSDPDGFDDDSNQYRYAQSRPVQMIDPSGRGTVCVLGKVAREGEWQSFKATATVDRVQLTFNPSPVTFGPFHFLICRRARQRIFWNHCTTTWCWLFPTTTITTKSVKQCQIADLQTEGSAACQVLVIRIAIPIPRSPLDITIDSNIDPSEQERADRCCEAAEKLKWKIVECD
jgi:RHS repeat-associated protein